MKTIHVIIDPQNDFIDDQVNNPSLAVNGALNNMVNIAHVLKNDKFDEVLITLDTHTVLDIAHTSWWRDNQGKEINPFTMISSVDILSGKYVSADPEMKEYSLNYTRALEKAGNYTHFVWPNHCIVGTKGHEIHDVIKNAINEINIPITYLNKGMNIKTEHYSAFKAEVPLSEDKSTELDIKTIEYINKFDKIVFSGEALSHCVRTSVLDFLNNIPVVDRAKVIILEDCAASVPGFESQGVEFLEKAQEMGARVMSSNDYLALNKKPKNKM